MRALEPQPVASSAMAVPAMSRWIQLTPGSTNFSRKAAACEELASALPGELVMSACLDLISSWWQLSTGILQVSYFTCLAASPKRPASQSEFENSPACFLPRATTIAPVRVDNSIMFLTLYFSCVQFMQSASTSRPSASVFPISTVIPLRDLMMSRGLQELELTKFYTKPMEEVRLTFKPILATLSIADSTEVAPCLSMCISLMLAVGLRLSPPESKQTPLPTKELHSCDSGFPLQARLMKIGSCQLALPTACIKLNLSYSSSLPRMTVILRLCLAAISWARSRKNQGQPSSPLRFAHYLDLMFACASSTTQSLSGKSVSSRETGSGCFSFLLNTYELASRVEAMPIKLACFWIAGENSRRVLFLICNLSTAFSLMMLTLVSFWVTSTRLLSLNSFWSSSATNLSASVEWMMWILVLAVPDGATKAGNMLAKL